MKRVTLSPRTNWQQRVEDIGFVFHSPSDERYWDESAAYEFTMAQIETLEAAANRIHAMCLEAVGHVIDNNLYHKFGIPPHVVPLIIKSWEAFDGEGEPSIYGRFDFSYDGIHPPKLLEYNADTPTSLLEAAVVQWKWLTDTNADKDQFNSIHERLVEYWAYVAPYLKQGPLYFACLMDNREDLMTTTYLADTASQAGLSVNIVDIAAIGYDDDTDMFVDEDNNPMTNIFKLYPWEWMIHEKFGRELINFNNMHSTFWIEPAWKMILSNKAILPLLWELNPNHENILPSFFEYNTSSFENSGVNYVKKPLLSREGANTTIHKNGIVTSGIDQGYGEEGFIIQELAELPNHNGNHPVMGVWMIGGEAAGLGIREDNTLITGNMSRFIPHYIN